MNLSSNPAISVVMSVHNGEKHLKEAVDSILTQTFREFEFIIIDDGSTDSSKAILKAYAAGDSRIRLVSRENRGLTKSLNEGTAIARGEFIARMDADDISLPTRLETQAAYFANNPSVALLSANMEVVNESGQFIKKYPLPSSAAEILWWSMFDNPFAHPAVMFRRSLVTHLQPFYDEAYPVAQDYELWERIIRRYESANLEECLVQYRKHAHSVQRQRGNEQDAVKKEVRQRAFVHLLERYSIKVQDSVVASGHFFVEGSDGLEDAEADKSRFICLAKALEEIRKNLALSKANPWVKLGYERLLWSDAHFSGKLWSWKLSRLIGFRDVARRYVNNNNNPPMVKKMINRFRSISRELRNHLELRTWKSKSRADGVRIDPGLIFYEDASGFRKCHFEAGAHIDRNVTVWIASDANSNPRLHLGKGAYIGPYSYLGVYFPIIIQDEVLIGAFSYIVSANHTFKDRRVPIRLQGFTGQAIEIERGAWLGTHVVVLPGVKIGEGAIIGAGSVVTHNVPPYEIWGGNPARFIKKRE